MSLFDSNGLRDRLFQDKSKVADSEVEFLPYYSIEHILNSHPLPDMMKVSKKEVHKCLTHMLSKYKSRKTVKDTEKKNDIKETNKKVCNNAKCKKPNLICAHRDGFYICNNCGSVQSKVYGENIHMAITEEELRQLENGGDQDIPQWVRAENEYGEIWNKIVLSQHVEHWNIYVNMNKDDLEEVKEISSWMEKRASNECRVVSAFIFKFIKDKLTDITTDNLLNLKFEQPSAKKICEHCNQKLYSIFDIKRHICKKNVQRKQWSYVKNKNTRMKFI